MKRAAAAAFLLVFGVGTAHAQEKASAVNVSVTGINNVYNVAKSYVLKTAEQVPQEKYSFKPTPEVRSIAELLGHIADSNKMFCAIAGGQPQPAEDMGSEKLTDKAALIAALQNGYAYCDGIVAKLSDADLTKQVTLFGRPATVAQVIALNAAHNYEHYGNLVTYMRINKMVPPSSQRGN